MIIAAAADTTTLTTENVTVTVIGVVEGAPAAGAGQGPRVDQGLGGGGGTETGTDRREAGAAAGAVEAMVALATGRGNGGEGATPGVAVEEEGERDDDTKRGIGMTASVAAGLGLAPDPSPAMTGAAVTNSSPRLHRRSPPSAAAVSATSSMATMQRETPPPRPQRSLLRVLVVTNLPSTQPAHVETASNLMHPQLQLLFPLQPAVERGGALAGGTMLYGTPGAGAVVEGETAVVVTAPEGAGGISPEVAATIPSGNPEGAVAAGRPRARGQPIGVAAGVTARATAGAGTAKGGRKTGTITLVVVGIATEPAENRGVAAEAMIMRAAAHSDGRKGGTMILSTVQGTGEGEVAVAAWKGGIVRELEAMTTMTEGLAGTGPGESHARGGCREARVAEGRVEEWPLD